VQSGEALGILLRGIRTFVEHGESGLGAAEGRRDAEGFVELRTWLRRETLDELDAA
jgi:hypothetical protein